MALEGSAGGFVAAGFETVALEFERNFSERARLRAPIDKTLSMWPARCSLGIPATGADTSVSAHRVPRSGSTGRTAPPGPRDQPRVSAGLPRRGHRFRAKSRTPE